jgi:CheY-like chemotaxis protein
MGYNEFLKEHLDPLSPLNRYTDEVASAAERAAKLTHQLLAFSRRQTLKPRVIDLNEIIGDIKNLLNRLIGEHIELRTALAPQLSYVKADPGQVEQVIVNLVVNARDAMPSGGVLTIETGDVSLPTTNGDQPKAPDVRLRISDTGTGMEQDVLDHIFEPFFTTKPEGKGTGLGLATCYGIVQQSGGRISVSSTPGQGSTFEVTLPGASEMPEQFSSVSTTEIPTGSETVFLVEDRAEVRRLAAQTLRCQGYTVHEAENGEDALRRISQLNAGETIHLLLTDVIMPRMGGRELAEQFHRIYPLAPVLFSSASEVEAPIGHAMAEGWAAFLQKPYTPGYLARKVREVLDSVSVSRAA